MANPKITYTPSGGTEQTLSFVSPPTRQPAAWKTAVRHDNVSSAGVRESVLERVDQFLEVNLDWIRSGADAANWQSFLDYALTGSAFAYYPDASVSSFTNYTLEDTDVRIEFKAAGVYTLTMKWREQIL
jgi:hypothetical protein